jgi:hypothetical protein
LLKDLLKEPDCLTLEFFRTSLEMVEGLLPRALAMNLKDSP